MGGLLPTLVKCSLRLFGALIRYKYFHVLVWFPNESKIRSRERRVGCKLQMNHIHI